MKTDAVQRMIVAARLRSTLEFCFAHWEAVPALTLDAIFEPYVREIAVLEDRREFDFATMKFLATLKNGHTYFTDGWLRRTGGSPLGFHARRIEDRWIVTKTQREGVRIGAEILAINGEPFTAFSRRQQEYIAASSERTAAELLFHRRYLFPKSFELQFSSGTMTVSVESSETGPPGSAKPELSFVTGGAIALLRIPSFALDEFETSAVACVRALDVEVPLIIDLRGNTGGTTPMTLAMALMDQPFRTWIEATPSFTGLGRAMGQSPEMSRQGPETIAPDGTAFSGRLALLIDGGCLSATEDFTAPFKDNGRATLFGEATGGSSGQPVWLDFGNDMSAAISTKRQWFLDGSGFEGVGIAPDVPVLPAAADYTEGYDPVLQAAIRHLQLGH